MFVSILGLFSAQALPSLIVPLFWRMCRALSVLFAGADRLDKGSVAELHLLGTQLFSLLRLLRRQMTQDSENVVVILWRVCPVLQMSGGYLCMNHEQASLP